MRELSLFTGAGGGVLGTLLLGWEHIGYVEYDDYCQKIIAQRIKDGILDEAPIFGDIRAFISDGYAEAYQGMVDVITAGFPCQPFSVAGKRAGEDDERNMWPATIECIRIIRPQLALLENVPGLLSSGYFQRVLGDLAEAGYDAEWCVLGASDVGANHQRKRLWILAESAGNGLRGPQLREFQGHHGQAQARPDDGAEAVRCREMDVADTPRVQQGRQDKRAERQRTRQSGEPLVENVADTEGITERARLCEGEQAGERGRRSGDEGGEGDVSNAGSTVLEKRCGETGERAHPATGSGSWWSTEPDVGRVAHGVAARVDRLKALGNGQVPAVVAAVWELLRSDS